MLEQNCGVCFFLMYIIILMVSETVTNYQHSFSDLLNSLPHPHLQTQCPF